MESKLKLRDSIYILQEKDKNDNYTVIFTATRKIKKFRVDQLVKDVIETLGSEKIESDLFKILSKKYQS